MKPRSDAALRVTNGIAVLSVPASGPAFAPGPRPTRSRLPVLLAIALLAASSLLAAVPASAAAPLRLGAPDAAPVASRVAPALPGPVVPTVPAVAHPNVKITLPCSNAWPAYADVGLGVTPNPSFAYQLGCSLYDTQDELHATFLSPQPYSGSRFTESVKLPTNPTQAVSYGGLYLAMVVSGDPRSPWNTSLAEVAFLPVLEGLTVAWNVSVTVYSLINSTSPSGVLNTCPNEWAGLAWNASYWCEGVDFSNGLGLGEAPTLLPGNTFFNVTFLGVAGRQAVTIWGNDSTDTSDSFSATLNNTTTGTYNFTPAYNASCEACLLNWSDGFGNGIGVGVCPGTSADGSCDTYNVYHWLDEPPAEFGIPEGWNGTGYGRDYEFLGFESSSGACSGTSSTRVALCQFPPDSTGFYPYFTFNGSVLNFGTSYNWTEWTLGGSATQFSYTGSLTAVTPLAVTSVGDSSDGGYIPGSEGFNVTARSVAVGHVVNASLVYRLGGGSWSSVAMSRVNGTVESGFYNASVPSSGGNGTITYFVYVLDRAGIGVATNPNQVVRGPIPTFTVDIGVHPSGCGGVFLNNTFYTNGASVPIHPGTYPLGEKGCYPFVDPTFTTTPHLEVFADQSKLTVRGNGTLDLSFTFAPPTLHVRIATGTCGGLITLGGTQYGDGNTADVTWGENYSLSATPCAKTAFAGYTFVGTFNVTVGASSQTFEAVTNGSLTAVFVNASLALPVLFATEPANCGGGIYFDGTKYLDGADIAVLAGDFAIAPSPCAKWGFLKWSVSGATLLNATEVDITATATLTMVQYALTIVTFAISPSDCGVINFDGTNYTNGESVVVANNSTHLAYAYPCANYSLLDFTANGGLALVGNVLYANGSGNLSMSSTPGNGTTWFVAFITNPAYCGTIDFEGVAYQDTNYTKVLSGTYATLSATPCADYGFLKWEALGTGITITGNTAFITGPGAIQAVFTTLVNVFLYTNPSTCGGVELGGTDYTDGATPAFAEGVIVPIAAVPCSGYTLDTWVYTPGITFIPGPVEMVQISGPAQLAADFTRIGYFVTVVLNPSNCGSVSLNATSEFSGATVPLAPGVYPLTTVPCQGDSVVGYSVTGNLTVVGNEVYVNGTGTLTILMEPVPPSITLNVPTTSTAGLSVALAITVAELVPPYNYTFAWNFGDGSNATTTQNSTYHQYSTAGTYLVSVLVHDPLGRTVSANATIRVEAVSQTASVGLLLPALAAVGLAAVIIALAWYFSGPGASAPAPEEPGIYGSGDLAVPEGSEETEATPDEPLPKEP